MLKEREIESLNARIAELSSDSVKSQKQLSSVILERNSTAQSLRATEQEKAERIASLERALEEEAERRVLTEKRLAIHRDPDSADELEDEGSMEDHDSSNVEAILEREARLRERRRQQRKVMRGDGASESLVCNIRKGA